MAAKTGSPARGGNVNVVQFVWPDAFTANYLSAYQRAQPAGVDLGQAAPRGAGPELRHEIQFVGHSLGSAVNAYARRLFPEPRDAGEGGLASRPSTGRTACGSFGDFQEDFFIGLLHPAKAASPGLNLTDRELLLRHGPQRSETELWVRNRSRLQPRAAAGPRRASTSIFSTRSSDHRPFRGPVLVSADHRSVGLVPLFELRAYV